MTENNREVVIGAFGAGELFGEYALLPPGLNTGTCRAAEEGEVLELPLAPLAQIISQEPIIHRHLKKWLRLHAVLNHLRDRTFLGFISAPSLVPLINQLESVTFAQGHAIQVDGLNADRFFVLIRGRASLESESNDGRIALERGDCFGARALLGRTGLPAVLADSDCDCVSLARHSFAPIRLSGTASIQTRLPHLDARASYPWIGQESPTDCGIAALLMAARYHGLTIPYADLQRKLCPGRSGVALLDLQHAAGDYGFKARAIRIGMAQIPSIVLPAIAHLAANHYVTLFAADSANVVLGDPAVGIRTVSLESFRASWSGDLLVLHRDDV